VGLKTRVGAEQNQKFRQSQFSDTGKFETMLNSLLVKILRFYQWGISPYLTPSCRFYPSCSEYSVKALEKYYLPKALARIITRLLKCHPWHEGGHDPIK
jgi:hypothetical protein